MSTSRLTKMSMRTSSQVPTPTVPPLGEALPEAATPVSEKTNRGGDDLAEIKKVMAKLLASVTAINERVRAVEGGLEKRLSPINDGDEAPKTPSR